MNDLTKNSDCRAGIDQFLPDTIFIGKGLSFWIKGWVFHPRHEIRNVRFDLDDASIPMEEIHLPRPDVMRKTGSTSLSFDLRKKMLYSGFSGCVDLHQDLTGKIKTIHIVAELSDHSELLIESKTVRFCDETEFFMPCASDRSADEEYPLIAICMATYNPDLQLFQKQIDSIRQQSYPNWICIISDDRSTAEIVDEIRNRIADDQRFILFENQKNLGFYHNFEQTLRHIPNAAQFIAFADQDDNWYPDKLSILYNSIIQDPTIKLVYSDMRIIGRKGEIISETYWQNRKNHYQNLELVMICGSVTGAASLFRRELLDLVLPFPQNTGISFHDHLVSCAALAVGLIEYIDKPLYDYYQHGRNIIGHHDFGAGYGQVREIISTEFSTFSGLKNRLRSFYSSYDLNYLRLRLISRTLSLRGIRNAKAFSLFNNSLLAVIRLLLMHIRIKRQKYTTEHAEIALAVSCLTRKYIKYLPIF